MGSATLVTNSSGETTQYFLNLPFGETMVEQQEPGVYENPYKFNAKELDVETNLYYYGARYYNPRLSIWYGVDPLAVYNPVMETEFYGDWHYNGGVGFWGNLNPYIYTYQNPIKYIDPNGKQVVINLPPPILTPNTNSSYAGKQFFSERDKQIASKIVNPGFGVFVLNGSLKITNSAIKIKNSLFDLFSSSEKLEPESGYKGSKKHGVKWKEGKATAKKEGKPQGQWGSEEDLNYAGEKAAELSPGAKNKKGKVTPGDFEDFPINPNNKSTVHNPDGSESDPDIIRVRNNGDGTFHGFPADSKNIGPIIKK